MKVKLEYRCRGCGKEWGDVEELDKLDWTRLVKWMGVHDRCSMHECGEGVAGQVEFVRGTYAEGK